MFDPMSDPQVSFFGVPPGLVLAGIAFVGLVVGFVWIRRITTVEEVSAFRSSARPGRNLPLQAGVLLGLLAIGLALTFGRYLNQV